MNLSKMGKFIADFRKENQMTQNTLGKELFIDRKVISSWENGKSVPNVAYLEKLANIMDVSIEELLNGEKNQDREDVVNK